MNHIIRAGQLNRLLRAGRYMNQQGGDIGRFGQIPQELMVANIFPYLDVKSIDEIRTTSPDMKNMLDAFDRLRRDKRKLEIDAVKAIVMEEIAKYRKNTQIGVLSNRGFNIEAIRRHCSGLELADDSILYNAKVLEGLKTEFTGSVEIESKKNKYFYNLLMTAAEFAPDEMEHLLGQLTNIGNGNDKIRRYLIDNGDSEITLAYIDGTGDEGRYILESDSTQSMVKEHKS